MSAEPLLIQPLHDDRTLACEGRGVLELSMSRPHLAGEGAAVRRVERYYARLCGSWLARWTGPLYRRACAAEETALSAARPFTPWRASFTWSVTHSDDTALSLCWEAVEEGDGQLRVCRRYDVWSRKDGRPLTLADVLPQRKGWRTSVRKALASQLEELADRTPEEVLPGWRSGLSRCIRAGHFYLSPEGPVVLARPGTLRPARIGWCAFPLTGQKVPGL